MREGVELLYRLQCRPEGWVKQLSCLLDSQRGAGADAVDATPAGGRPGERWGQPPRSGLADGPVEERGRRSGINAAVLRLLPDQDLQAKGDGAYGKFLSQAATTKGTKR